MSTEINTVIFRDMKHIAAAIIASIGSQQQLKLLCFTLQLNFTVE